MKSNTKIFLLILILALTLRLIHLNDKAYGTDEVHSINNSKAIINEGLKGVYDFGNPPGFYIISGIILFLSNSILILKLTMVAIGILTIMLTYLLVSKMFNEKIALVSAFLLAINPMHVLLSQHIRVYILLMLVYLVSVLALYKFIKTKSNKSLVVLVTSYIIAIYLHYFSVLFVISHLIVILVISNKNKILMKKYFIGLTIVAILSSLIIPYFLWQYDNLINQEKLTTIDKLSITKVPYPIYKFSSMMDISSTLEKAPYLIITAPIVFIIFLLGSFSMYKQKKWNAKFILLNLILPILMLALLGFIFPIYSFRYLTYLLPMYIIPMSYVKNKKLGFVLLLIIAILWFLVLFNYYSIATLKTWPVDFAI